MIKTYFENIKDVIIKELNNSKTTIRIALAYFTDNDIFEIFPTEGVENIQGTIYNRWGELVYEWKGLRVENFWNGKYKNQDASQGVYYYIITYEDFYGKQFERKGSLTLIR